MIYKIEFNIIVLVLNDNYIISYGKKTNLKSYYIKKSFLKDTEKFDFEKSVNMLLILQLKLFEYKLISRADISKKLAEMDMNLDEYLKEIKIHKKIMEYFKDFYNCKYFTGILYLKFYSLFL